MGAVKLYPQAAMLRELANQRRVERIELEARALELMHKARPIGVAELGAELWPHTLDTADERERRTKRADKLLRRLERMGWVASELRTQGARELRLYRRVR